jgi:predicted GNAT family acetyltransferase
MKKNTPENLLKLSHLLPEDSKRALCHQGKLEVPACWTIFQEVDVFQMVLSEQHAGTPDDKEIRILNNQDVPAMLALTKLTHPGPFSEKTLLFGHYAGIFIGNRLASMAGQRMHPVPYAEISAVCTHPDFSHRGLAGKLINYQIRRICAASQIPFLHVKTDNEHAIRLYERLGFVIRKEMKVFILGKNGKP